MTTIHTIYKKLFTYYGEPQWWPADSPFEVMVGAILTQNTAWQNVEKAIANLKQSKMLTPDAILKGDIGELAAQLKPSGYFNIKAKRLRNYCDWYRGQGEQKELSELDTAILRTELLSVNGVGPETADDILLYAFNRPVFVIDAYTRRIFSRLGMIAGDEGYEALRLWFENHYQTDVSEVERVEIYRHYHALIVMHAKAHCRKKADCDLCPVIKKCRHFTSE
ncbi:MAG: endonuclease III domain-containing protein [Chromatiales bacterium]|nr:endonuclease III domain-containing protein [Chromatiales bacterium]